VTHAVEKGRESRVAENHKHVQALALPVLATDVRPPATGIEAAREDFDVDATSDGILELDFLKRVSTKLVDSLWTRKEQVLMEMKRWQPLNNTNL